MKKPRNLRFADYIRCRAELFFVLADVLHRRWPEWTPTPQLICGLTVLDTLGYAKFDSDNPADRAEVQKMLDEALPICLEVMTPGSVPFAGRENVN